MKVSSNDFEVGRGSRTGQLLAPVPLTVTPVAYPAAVPLAVTAKP